MFKSLVWTENEDILRDYELVDGEKNLRTLLSSLTATSIRVIKQGLKRTQSNKVVKIENNKEFSIIFKRNSVWTSIEFENLVLFYLLYKENTRNIKTIKEIVKIAKKHKVSFPFYFKDKEHAFYKKLLEFYLAEGSLGLIEGFLDGKAYFSSKRAAKIKDENKIKDFFVKLAENRPMAGLSFIRVEKISETKYIASSKYGEFLITNNEDCIEASSFLRSNKNDKHILRKYSNGTLQNLFFNARQDKTLTNIPRKISSKDILTWTISLSIVIILFWITFSFIYDNTNTGTVFKIIFDDFTWRHIWIYLMSVNFLFSLVYGPLLVTIINRIISKKKISWKSFASNMAARQLRLTAAFLTGNAVIATMVWAWYQSSVNKIRTVSVIGSLATFSILRGIVMLPIGGIFMIRGTIFNHTIMNEYDIMNQYYAYTTLSWIGWIWHIIHNLSISLLIVFPPLHILYNKILELWYGMRKNTNQLINKMTTFENNLILLKRGSKTIFKNRARILRVSLFILIGILVELFEFTYGLRMVEDYNIHYGIISIQKGTYWNLFAISSVRFMSGFAYHVPILNALPGQGMGITDAMLSASTSGVINHAHISESLSRDDISDLSVQTTFLMRFYNFYMRRIVALFSSVTLLTNILIIKRMRK